MTPLSPNQLNDYVNEHISEFHTARLRVIENLNLRKLLLKKNPYLYRAKDLTRASEIVEHLLTSYLSSSEEELFGHFLEGLAIFVANQTHAGQVVHSHVGIDLEFVAQSTYHIVQIKSGPNWGNADQHRRLKQNFELAFNDVSQSHQGQVRCVLGICYGKRKTKQNPQFETLMGQRFWQFVSGSENFYVEIVEPIGYNAQFHNEQYKNQFDILTNLLNEQLLTGFFVNGQLDWNTLLKLNSGAS